MKSIVIEKPIRDVDGVLNLLKAQDPPFAIMSVGTDPKRTYIYLDDDEARDPSPFIRDWQDAPELRVSAAGAPGLLGVVDVPSNGSDVHTILIEKVTPAGEIVPGNEKLLVSSKHNVKISNTRPKLSEGTAIVEVGPSKIPGEAVIEVLDPSWKIRGASVVIRFVRPKPVPAPPPAEVLPPDAVQPETPPDSIKKGGILATLRRILGLE